MRPTEILSHEHRVIEVVLDCLDAIVDRCERDGRLDGKSASQAIDFLRSFADRCHHAKEEDQLFPLLETHGFSADAGPTAVMRAEHVQGRNLIAAMEQAVPAAAAGDEAGRKTWAQATRLYTALLRDHIEKEDHCLFPMADRTLRPSEMDDLVRRFEAVERHDIGAGVHERYVHLAEELADRFGVRTDGVPAEARRCGCSGHD